MGRIWKVIGSVLAVAVIGAFGFCTVWTIRNWDTVYQSLDGSSVYSSEDIKRTEQETWEKAAKNETEYQKTIAELRDLVTSLQVDNAALSDEVAALNLSISSNESEIRQLSARKASLEAQVASLQATNNDNDNTITALNAQIIHLNQQISEMIYLSQTYNMQVNSLNNRINELTASVNYYENYIATLEDNDKAVATYELDGTVWKIEIITKGTEITLNEPSNTDSYIFNGWKVSGSNELLSNSYTLNSNTKFIADLTYKHTVKFINDNQTYEIQKVTENEHVTIPTDPTKDGYAFIGWSINGADVLSDIDTTPITADTVYYAVYVKLHTVTFKVDDQIIATQIIRNGNYVDESGITVETDGTFNGWSVDNSAVDLSTYQIFNDTVFVARISYVYLNEITFSGLTNFNGNDVWTDGINCYYSHDYKNYVLNISTRTWTPITWNGLTNITASDVWTDGVNYYYSDGSRQYVLNTSTRTWTSMTWSGLTSFQGNDVWTDGVNYYYSFSKDHYILNVSTHTWSKVTWSGYTSFHGDDVWTDGANYYVSYITDGTYILNVSTRTWTKITMTGSQDCLGSNVWTDGVNYFYTYTTKLQIGTSITYFTWNRVLNTKSNNWIEYYTSVNGSNVWTDGKNYYYSSGTSHYLLNPKAVRVG